MRSSLPSIYSLFVFVFKDVPLAYAATQTCYYPNGAIASDQVPCSDGQFSACCHRNAICLSNNLCMGIKQPFVLGRGACTDPDWGSENCPQQCQTGDYFTTVPVLADQRADSAYKPNRQADARSSSSTAPPASTHTAATPWSSLPATISQSVTSAPPLRYPTLPLSQEEAPWQLSPTPIPRLRRQAAAAHQPRPHPQARAFQPRQATHLPQQQSHRLAVHQTTRVK